MTPYQDAFLSVETGPLVVEKIRTPGSLDATSWVVRADLLGFGSKSRCLHHAHCTSCVIYCGRGDSNDLPLACALTRATGSKFIAVILPGGSSVEIAKNEAYTRGMGGTVRRLVSAAEEAQHMACQLQNPETSLITAGLRGEPCDYASRGAWMLNGLDGLLKNKKCLWVYHKTGITAQLLRAALPPTIRIVVMVSEKEDVELPFEILGCGSRDEFVELFYATAAAEDVLWLE